MKDSLKLLMFLGIILLLATSCGTSKDGAKYKLGELIVQLKGTGNIETLTSDLEEQDVKVKQVISERMKMYLVNYNMIVISQQKMIEKLKAHEMVQNVELNNKVDQRED